MSPRAFIGLALAAALAAGCDPAPPKPETGSSTATVESRAPAAGAERGIRLFGRGIARERQIRV